MNFSPPPRSFQSSLPKPLKARGGSFSSKGLGWVVRLNLRGVPSAYNQSPVNLSCSQLLLQSPCMFRKVLIANRGEIAVRIIRALRELNIESVAVFSDVDRTALHVRMADEAEHIGPAPSSESYLRIDRILEAAKKHGA